MSRSLIPIGSVTLLQISTEKLITNDPAGRTYDVESLVQVPSFMVGTSGVIAQLDGGWVLNRRHAAHPAATVKHDDDRVLSIGFRSHYERMGTGVPLGVAGENIVVETGERIHPEDVAAGFVIRTSGGDLELDPPKPLTPCVPFAKFIMGDQQATEREVSEVLDRLRGGIRGFGMGTSQIDGYATVQVGDLVFRRETA